MAKDNRSSVAVGRDTAAALKGIADAVGATVGDLLRLAALKPTAIQRAYLEGLRAEAYARLVKLDRRAASGSSAASAEPRPSAAAASSGLRLGWRYVTACNSPVGTRERRGGGSGRWRRRSRSAADVRRRREARGQSVRGTE